MKTKKFPKTRLYPHEPLAQVLLIVWVSKLFAGRHRFYVWNNWSHRWRFSFCEYLFQIFTNIFLYFKWHMTINKSCFYLIIILAKCLIMDLANGDGCKSDLLNSISKILKGQQSSYNFSHITMLSPGRRDGGSCITLTLEIACFYASRQKFFNLPNFNTVLGSGSEK